MSVSPIRPDEVASQKQNEFPDWAIEVWNRLIAMAWSSGRAVVKQGDAVSALREANQGIDPIHDFLEVEDIYRQAGWDVEYDKPGFNESYPATFTFAKPKKR